MKKNQIFELIKLLAPSDSYLALHGIADISDLNNHYSSMSKEEKANNIINIGLINERSTSIAQTAIVYGLIDSIPNDRVPEINNYTFFSPSKEQAVIIIAIPKYFEDSKGRKIFGGYRSIDYKDKEKSCCLSEYLFRDTIPPEMILGYYLHIDDSDEAIFVENPKYYTKLTIEEKDTFIEKHFDQHNFILDINNPELIERYKSQGELLASLGSIFLKNTIEQYNREKGIGQL